MNTYVNKITDETRTILIFGGLGTKYDEMEPICQNSIIFEFTNELFKNRLVDIIPMIKNKIDELVTNDIIIIGISIGGLLATMYYELYPKYINGIILIDSTNPSSIPYLTSKKKLNDGIDYNDIILEIEKNKNFKMNNIIVTSHINIKMTNSRKKDIYFKSLSENKKYMYYKSLSTHPKSSVIVYPDSCHDLHLKELNSIQNTIKDYL
jgi:predicted esterase YcpF (UPF0227 family)